LHSIWLRLLGFAWVLTASLFLIFGGALAFLGLAGGLLVRARPDTSNVINYDPSTVATFSPLPIAIGAVLLVCFALRARTYGR
jgi:hypothetical protein